MSVVVVGAGIVGLAVAFHLHQQGADVTVVDRAPEGDKASFGNGGGIAVTEVCPASVPGLAWRVPRWLIDPLGPLAVRPAHALKLLPWLVRFSRSGIPKEVERIATALASLNGRVYDDLLPMLSSIGLSDQLNRKGALTVYETKDGFDRDNAEWELKRSHGVSVDIISGNDARDIEPALGPIVSHAAFTEQWSHVSDPKYLVDTLRRRLVDSGVSVVSGEVRHLESSGETKTKVFLEEGGQLEVDKVVIAAGAWSGILAKRLGESVLIESERGYNMTLPTSNVSLSREIIFAEKKFVATPLSCGLRIGGAAEFGGLDARPNYKRSHALVQLASRYLPGLKTIGGTTWSGHRPTTPDSLPVICSSSKLRSVFYAFGHGHLGLTQAATTGRLITDLIYGRPLPIDISPFSIARFR